MKDRAYYHRACQVAKATIYYTDLKGMNLVEASSPVFYGCHGWGDTNEEALKDFLNGLDGWLTLVDMNGRLPKLPSVKVSIISKSAKTRAKTV